MPDNPLLAIFAHPDDETFTAAGLFAAASAAGIPVIVVSATRGEEGESAIPDLDGPEALGAERERELREAMRQVGVNDVRFLGYRDSGMEGSPSAEHPDAFIRVPLEDVAARLATLIREVRPGIVVTFGDDGIYGHPDHLHMHQAALLAVAAAADADYADRTATPWQTPVVYFATMSRERLLALAEIPDSPLASLPDEARERLGTPLAEITHPVDITPWSEQKLAAILAHRTQTAEGGPLASMPQEQRQAQLSHEWFVRAPLPWAAAEDDFIARLAASGGS